MPSYCCVPGCRQTGGHLFPKNKLLRNKWIHAVRRGEHFGRWIPSSATVVCRNHFLPSDYISVTAHGTSPLKNQLKEDACPSVFPWCKGQTGPDDRQKRRLLRSTHQVKSDCSVLSNCNTGVHTEFEPFSDDNVLFEELVSTPSTALDQTQQDKNICQSDNLYMNVGTQTLPSPVFSVDKFMFDSLGIMFYTGLSCYTDFLFVLASLGEGAYHLNYAYNRVENLSVENQFFLTLIKLRQHKTNFEISRLFGICEKSVINIWITWVNFMARQWREINIWPERDVVSYYTPSDFHCKFPSTRIIIDGTECPIKKPKNPIAQQSTYSTYKNRNTVKVLAGATPGGLVSYLSPAYGGSTSDRQIVERSMLMECCDPGDSIMADKGFNVQDIFATKDVKLNIPTFFRKKNRMCGKTVLHDRKISSKRVHIERIIGLAKTYKILTSPMNNTETKLASEIIFICFMLCNFRKCIIPKHA